MSEMEISKVLAQMRSLSQGAATPAAKEPVAGGEFANVLSESINKVSEVQQEAMSMASNWEKGSTDVELSDVMLSMQKSSISFQAMMEVRNKLVEAYREIMNMTI